jgi:hypothetical protein
MHLEMWNKDVDMHRYRDCYPHYLNTPIIYLYPTHFIEAIVHSGVLSIGTFGRQGVLGFIVLANQIDYYITVT